MTQEELSHRSGLHRTYISDIERGARNVSLKNMGKLAAALDVLPSVLMRWTELRNASGLKGLPELVLEPELLSYLNGMGVGYVLVDQAGAVINANGMLAQWLARPLETLAGSCFLDSIADDDLVKVRAALEAVRSGVLSEEALKVRLQAVSGETMPVSLQFNAVNDECNEFAIARIGIYKDATSDSGAGTAPAGPPKAINGSNGGIPMPAVVAIKDELISFWSEPAHSLFGYTAREVIGAPITLIMSEQKISELAVHYGQVSRQQMDVRCRTKNSTLLDLSMMCIPVPVADQADFSQLICFFSQQAESHNDNLVALELAVVSTLEEAESFKSAVPKLLTALAADRFHFAMLWWMDPDYGRLRPFDHVTIDMPPQTMQALTEGIRFLSFGMPLVVWETRQSLWIPDVRSEALARPQVRSNQLGLTSGVWFPITVGQEVIGVFELLSKNSLSQDDQMLKLFTALGARIGRSILRSGVGEPPSGGHSPQRREV